MDEHSSEAKAQVPAINRNAEQERSRALLHNRKWSSFERYASLQRSAHSVRPRNSIHGLLNQVQRASTPDIQIRAGAESATCRNCAALVESSSYSSRVIVTISGIPLEGTQSASLPKRRWHELPDQAQSERRCSGIRGCNENPAGYSVDNRRSDTEGKAVSLPRDAEKCIGDDAFMRLFRNFSSEPVGA